MDKTNYFYVLYCRDNTLYGGYTTNLSRRLKEHNSGQGAKYTRPARRRPAKFLYAEAYPSRSLAMKAEYAFKRQSRVEKEAFLKEQGVEGPFEKVNETVINYVFKEEKDEESKEF